MGISPEKNYNVIYLSVSFLENPKISKSIKERCPEVEIPYILAENITPEIKEVFDSYVYLEDGERFGELYGRLTAQFGQIIFTVLGRNSGREILESLGVCVQDSYSTVELGHYYRIVEGALKNLVVKAISFKGENTIVGQYKVIEEVRNTEVTFSNIERIPEEDAILHVGSFINYMEKETAVSGRKAIIIDGNHILYRSMFSPFYNKIYCRRDERFVGGSLGFYFTLLKLKEVYVEYEVHVVFDGYDQEKFDDNPEYKKGRVQYREDFKEAFKENQGWIKDLVYNLGFYLYHFETKEADDVIGSLAHHMEHNLGYQDILIYSTDKDFYQLITPMVKILSPKENFRGHSEVIGEKEALEKFEVNRVSKINWIRALIGDHSDNIPSLNAFNKKAGQPSNIKKAPLLSMINTSETMEELAERMRQDVRVELFVKSGQFERSFKLLSIFVHMFATDDDLVQYKGIFNKARFFELLEANSFYKELEMSDKVLRVFRGIW